MPVMNKEGNLFDERRKGERRKIEKETKEDNRKSSDRRKDNINKIKNK